MGCDRLRLVGAVVNGVDLLALAAEVEAGKVKALSIKQPYPHHIFHDGKDVENRDWPTRFRGWIFIHAGKAFYDNPPAKVHAALPRGGVVGMARVVDCVTKMDSEWFFGDFGLVLRDAFPVPLVPCRGQLGFFRPPIEVLTAAARHIRARHFWDGVDG